MDFSHKQARIPMPYFAEMCLKQTFRKQARAPPSQFNLNPSQPCESAMNARRGILEGKFAAFYSVVCARSSSYFLSDEKSCRRDAIAVCGNFPHPCRPPLSSAFPLYVPFAARIMMLGKCTAKWQFLPLSPIGYPKGKKGGGPKNGFLAERNGKDGWDVSTWAPFKQLKDFGKGA